MWRCRMTRGSTRAPRPTTDTGDLPTRPSSRLCSPRGSIWTGAARSSMSAAGLASSLSGSPTCSGTPSASIPTRPCSLRVAESPTRRPSRTFVGSGPGRRPAGSGAGAIPRGHLRPVLSLDRRSSGSRGGVRHVGARRDVGADRPHGRRPAGAAESRAAGDPTRRDRGARAEVPRLNPPRRPWRRTGSDPSFRSTPCSTRFGAPRTIFAPGVPDLVRDTESVLSGYFSMSSSAPRLFGDQVEDFAEEVRRLLTSRSPAGIFWDWPGDTEITLARKPGRTGCRGRRS